MAAIASSFWGLADRLSEIRKRLNLPSPGPYENLHREIKGVFPTLHQIEGAKFDLHSILSQNFQTSHSFSWGNPQQPPTYQFGATYATPGLLMSGQVDHEGGLQARAHYNWVPLPQPPPHQTHDPANVHQPTHAEGAVAETAAMPEQPRITSTTKMQALLTSNPAHNMVQLEHDHNGADWSLNVKAVNPNPIDAPPSWARSAAAAAGRIPPTSSVTGIFSASYLQSITRSLAVGTEMVYQRATPDLEEPALSFALRYAPPASPLAPPPILPPGFPSPYMPINPKDPTQVFTATWSPAAGLWNMSYWRRLNQRLELGTELQMLITTPSFNSNKASAPAAAPGRREAVAFAGFKLDTVYATVRAMIDSHGHLSAVVEEKIAPGLTLQLCGELDYSSSSRGGPGMPSKSGRVGIGFTLEA